MSMLRPDETDRSDVLRGISDIVGVEKSHQPAQCTDQLGSIFIIFKTRHANIFYRRWLIYSDGRHMASCS